MYRFLAHLSLTCVEGKADVRRVSWVSSIGRLLGTLSTKAAWSGVAAHAVILNPATEETRPVSGAASAHGARMRLTDKRVLGGSRRVHWR